MVKPVTTASRAFGVSAIDRQAAAKSPAVAVIEVVGGIGPQPPAADVVLDEVAEGGQYRLGVGGHGGLSRSR